ncbi:MAG: ATP-grasp domain-containing protein, partial [Deltaproteobacteria bacterium]|nr:ATP-grasp domain-containing protein [Deltaproteobacteria bacterium]
MDVGSVRALRGPNIWTRRTVLELKVTVGPQSPVVTSEGLARLQAALPNLLMPVSSLREGAHLLPYLLERTALALLQQAGVTATFGRTAPATEPGHFEVVVEYVEEAVGRRTVEVAREMLAALLDGTAVDVPATVKALRSLNENSRLGPTTGSIVKAAQRRGIPVRRLNEGSLVQFGWGVRQRRILAAETDTTGAIAESIAQDKELTKQLLRSVGCPCPDGRTVSDAEDAWAAALEIGLPVVVKPRYGNQGRGVAVNLKTREQVLAAYAASHEEGSSVMVERCAPGVDYRLLVIGNKLVAAARRDPPLVMGDGARTIRELVDEVNKDPRRGEDHATSLSKIPLDAIALAVLAEQGLAAESVPAPGQRVVLRRNANLSTGGSATDVTDEVHPDVSARAVDAARVIGLDICGVDVVCGDIRHPLEHQGGVMVEVNAAPGFRMHLDPSYG